LTKIELPCDILSKTTSIDTRERILKTVREKKQIIYKGKPIKITADFSMRILKARRALSEVFRALNENNFNPRILYPVKLSFKIDGAIKVKQYMTTKPSQQNILQGILHIEYETNKTMRGQAVSNHRRRKDKESESTIDSAAHNQTLKQQKQLNDRNRHIPINTTTEC
jgi:hypothetical protein